MTRSYVNPADTERRIVIAACRMLDIRLARSANYNMAVRLAFERGTNHMGVPYHRTSRGGANSLYLIHLYGMTSDTFAPALEWATIISHGQVNPPALVVVLASKEVTETYTRCNHVPG